MNSLEEQLHRLTPASPSPELMRRLVAARPAKKIARPVWDWLQWVVPVGATAALVLAAVHFAGVNRPVGETYRAVETVNYVLGAKQVGVVHDKAGQPYRVLHCVGVNRQVWENVASGALVEKTYPEQRVLLVAMETY